MTDRLHGAMPALVTPLTPDREVHEEDLRTVVAAALAGGAAGVLVAGTTGEGALLEPGQRQTLTRVTREVTDATATVPTDDVPDATAPEPQPLVVAGASGPTVVAVREDIARLSAAGADLVLVLAPSTYPLTSEELTEVHLDLAGTAEVDLLVYHIPQLTGSELAPDDVRRLAGHPRIVGMKDSSDDADRRARFVEVAGATDGFAVMTGHAPTLRTALEDGVTGSITAIANLRLRQVVALHAAVAADDEGRATPLQAGLTSTSRSLGEVGPSTVAALKAALQLEGTISERWCRPPLGSVAPGRLDRVRTALLR